MLCIENNATRDQALLLIESLRAFGGRFARCPVFAVAPRPGLGVDAATRARLDQLEATYHEAPLNTLCPEYGSANRVYAAAWAASSSHADTLFVLDSDSLFLGEPAALPEDIDLLARPVDFKGSATRGPGDPFEAYWAALGALAGVGIDRLPFVVTTLDRQRVRASYNGGYAVVRRSSGLLERTAELFSRSVAAGLRPYRGQEDPRIFSSVGWESPRAGEFWGSNQAALAIAAAAAGARVELLDRRHNAPLHALADPAQWREEWRGIGPVHVHYHWMLQPEHREAALRTLVQLGAAAAAIEFVARRSPLGAPGRPAPAAARPLIVAGMHRSATSLVASVFAAAGLAIGEELLGPGPGNRKGHFEDRDFWLLHEDQLKAGGVTALGAGDGFTPPPGEDFRARARQLVARRQGLAWWGFKDPRACLFLDFWEDLLPEARYVFLYRHPVEVALSLRRRGTEPEVRLDPWAGIRAWEVYNRRLLAFAGRHPDRVFLAQAPALTADLPGLVTAAARKLGLPAGAVAADALYSPEDLASCFDPVTEAAAGRDWPELIGEALELYERLEAVADLPSSAVTEAAMAPASGAIAGAERDLAALHHDLGATRAGPFERVEPESEAGWRGRLQALQAELALTRQQRDRALRQEAETSHAYRVTAAHRDLLVATLADIESSRLYGLIHGWWKIAGRLRRRPPLETT